MRDVLGQPAAKKSELAIRRQQRRNAGRKQRDKAIVEAMSKEAR